MESLEKFVGSLAECDYQGKGLHAPINRRNLFIPTTTPKTTLELELQFNHFDDDFKPVDWLTRNHLQNHQISKVSHGIPCVFLSQVEPQNLLPRPFEQT